LDVSHAFHSPLMDPIIPEIERSARSLSAKVPSIPWISNVTATPMSKKPSAAYWRTQVRQPVLFHEGVRALNEMGCSTVIEVGAHPTLLPLMAASFAAEELSVIPTLRRDKHDLRNMLTAAGTLFTTGVAVDIERVAAGPGRRRMPCPEYPFREHRYWIKPRGNGDRASAPAKPAVRREAPRVEPEVAASGTHAMVAETANGGPPEPTFQETVSVSTPWADHRVFGTTVFPAAGYVEMAARAYASTGDDEWQPVTLNAVQFLRPLVLRYGQERELGVRVSNEGGEEIFVVQVAAGDQDEAFCTGRIGEDPGGLGRVPLDELREKISDEIAVPRFYGALRKAGLEYGGAFATVREMWVSPDADGTALARIAVSGDESSEPAHSFGLSTLLDGCLHVIGAALLGPELESPGGAFVPASMERVALACPLPSEVWAHVTVRTNEDASAAVATARLSDADGNAVAILDGVELRHTQSLGTDETGVEIAPQISFGPRDGGTSRASLEKKLRTVPAPERAAVVTGWLTDEIRETLGEAARDFAIDLDELDASAALLEVGLDSLLVTELQRRIQEKLNFRFAAMEAVDYQSLDSLAQYILDEVIVLDAGTPTETATAPALAGQAAEE
ncbi:MAG: polyketide synthase dehydratase domain-containing protein, partial [Gaiellaceae bacterium]